MSASIPPRPPRSPPVWAPSLTLTSRTMNSFPLPLPARPSSTRSLRCSPATATGSTSPIGSQPIKRYFRGAKIADLTAPPLPSRSSATVSSDGTPSASLRIWTVPASALR
ncbi:hypothetical protein BGZ94_005197 [Podila epigama]|nr:hypothetical protein BGZ94_005197 [Podila epigama]